MRLPFRHGRLRALRALMFASMLACAALLPNDASAQIANPEQDLLFARTIREPTNVALAFEHARVARDNRDYEAAIGTLERLLVFNPGLSRVRYELGALYYRLGSYEMAIRYFRDALAQPGLDEGVRRRIETYLPLAEKQREPSRLSIFLQAGLRYQTNPNFVPETGTLRLGGADFLLAPQANQRGGDWGSFGLAGIRHDYDLQNQRGDVLETRFVAYGSQQFRVTGSDVGLVDASFGPRLALAPDLLPGWTVKPYVVGGSVWFDGGQFSSGGAGVSLGIPLATNVSIEPLVEWRRTDFSDRPVASFSTLSSGDLLVTGLAATIKVSEDITVEAKGGYGRVNGRFVGQDFDRWSGEASVKFEFDPPMETMPRNWSFAPFVKVLETRFDDPNPFIDPTVRRRDHEWRAGFMLDMPVTAYFGMSTTMQYGRNDSNIPNYSNDNLSILFGPTARF